MVEETKLFDVAGEVESGWFHLDSRRSVVCAGGALWIDGKNVGAFADVREVRFSADGQRLAFVHEVDDRSALVVDGERVAEHRFICRSTLAMRDFFIGELAHRGFRRDDFSDTPPFGGPLYDQIVYRPTACEDGEGVAGDGTITWAGGDARYLYVLATGADNPTVPPNLDLPDGTLWRVDVPSDGAPVTSESVVYGQTPGGLSQRFPASGDPAALVPGTEYYLYVTRDVGIPITRCLFTF